jgi:hypothetical protein
MNVDSSIFEAIVIPPGKAYKASKKFTQSQEKSSCDCPVDEVKRKSGTHAGTGTGTKGEKS